MKQLLARGLFLAGTILATASYAQDSGGAITITSNNVDTVSQKALDGCTSPENCAVRLKQAYSFLGESLRRFERTTKERNEAVQLINTLSSSLNELNSKYEAAIASLDAARQKNLGLSDQIAGKENEAAELKRKLADAEKKIADLKQQIADNEAKIAELQSDKDRAEKKSDDLANKLADAEREIKSLKAENQKSKDENADLIAKLEDAQRNAVKLQKDLDAANLEMDSLNAKLGDLDSLNSKLEAQGGQARTEADALQKQLELANQEIADLKAQKAKLERELANATKVIERQKTELSKLQDKSTDDDQKLSGLTSKLAKTEAEKAEIAAQLASANDEIDKLKSQLAEAEKARKILANLVGDLNNITVHDLRPVALTRVNPQDWLINNVYLRYLRDETIESLIPLKGSPIATAGIEQVQREMNAWMVQNQTNLKKLGLPLQRRECGVFLCLDGIVGLRTREVALLIDSRDPKFWRGSATLKNKQGLKETDK